MSGVPFRSSVRRSADAADTKANIQIVSDPEAFCTFYQ